MSDEKVFAQGFSFKRRDNAPDFVVGRVSIKAAEAVEWMRTVHKDGWVNLNINQAKSGAYYMELDTFVPKKQGDYQAPAPAPTAQSETKDDLPF